MATFSFLHATFPARGTFAYLKGYIQGYEYKGKYIYISLISKYCKTNVLLKIQWIFVMLLQPFCHNKF